MFDPKIYTVGWICAISTEFVAARAFLDEVHEAPRYVAQHDNNNYVLGCIGSHNVVIAALSFGEYGMNSAVTVARDILHSFPNVRIGLMVGIGGGAPSQKHDIRLGDIVVGSPGVFQYDFGKAIRDDMPLKTGLLNQPPVLLRTALATLKATYEMKGQRLIEDVNKILEKFPRMRRKYSQPSLASDRLYRSHTVHPSNSPDGCDIACGNDATCLITRLERDKEDDNPAIHYGLIASANLLVKDACIRDTLAAERDVLCFEMEAAGIMDSLPYLVIRGICDYSDSHKNKEWQGFAAMMAAAYAKDLLLHTPPEKVEAEKPIGELLGRIQEDLSSLHYVVAGTTHAVREVSLGSLENKKQLEDAIDKTPPGLEHAYERNWSQPAPITGRVAFTESDGNSSDASGIFSEEAVSTKPSTLEEGIISVDEDHATRQMAKTFYSHKQVESSCDNTNDDIRSLISGSEDIQSQDGSNSTLWEVREAAADYLADMLAGDPKLSPLYEEALKGLDDARFVRNHIRLLRRYYLSLLSQAPSQKQGAAVDFLRPRSHRTLISRRILDKMGREIVPVILPQEDERNLILERFLNKVEAQTPEAPNHDEGSETESSVDDDEDEDDHEGFTFADLDDARSYFASGKPLMQFETEFRGFLHPSHKDVEDTQEETRNQIQSETEPMVTADPVGWACGIVYWKDRLSSWLSDTWCPPKQGYQRVRYICECGDRMFLDVKELSPGGIRRFRQRFEKDGHARLLGPRETIADQDSASGNHSRSGVSTPPSAHLRSERGQSTSSPRRPGPGSSQSGRGPSTPRTDTSGSEEVAFPQRQQNAPRYLLLCVNQKSLPVLDHIDCGSLANDQYLFQQIFGRYHTLRAGSDWRLTLLFPSFMCTAVGKASSFLKHNTPGWLEWVLPFFQKLSEASLYKMSKGDYVRFELIPMGDGATNPQHFKHGEYPPLVEFERKRYLYDPAPMDVAIDGIDLPHLTRPDRQHRTKHWVTRLPKKLQSRLERREEDDGIVLGWGIRIHECLNWHLVFSLLLVSLVVIWAIVAVYLACKGDDSSGFGLGALLAAFAAVYVPLQYQAWKENLD